MRKLLFAVCLVSLPISAMASCDSLKSQIDAKLKAKGVVSYSLEVVPVAQAEASTAAPATPAAPAAAAAPAKASEGKVVGTCEGDSKQIIYKRI